MQMRRLKFNWPRRRELIYLIVGAALALGGMFMTHEIQNMPKPLRYEDKGVTIKWLPKTVSRWDESLNQMGQLYNVNPNYLAIIMTLESGGNPKADSGQASGLMQITAPTAKDIASRYLKKPVSKYDLTHPATSIEFGAAYIAMLRDQYNYGNSRLETTYAAELIATAYNGGFGAANAIDKGEGINDSQTIVYARDVFNMWRERGASSSPTYQRWLERGGQALVDAAKQQ